MPAVNIAVIAVNDSDPKDGCRWSVSKDGEEIEHGVAADADAAYEAAKPYFERLRTEMALKIGEKAI